jgi:hypothetical protein
MKTINVKNKNQNQGMTFSQIKLVKRNESVQLQKVIKDSAQIVNKINDDIQTIDVEKNEAAIRKQIYKKVIDCTNKINIKTRNKNTAQLSKILTELLSKY